MTKQTEKILLNEEKQALLSGITKSFNELPCSNKRPPLNKHLPLDHNIKQAHPSPFSPFLK